MPPSLPYLPAELVDRVVEELPIKDARNLRSTCDALYRKSGYAFNKKCFNTLSINITRKSQYAAKRFLKDKRSSLFLRKILIRIDQGEYDKNRIRKRDRQRFMRTLIKALEVSPKCDTIIIYDSRHEPMDDRRDAIAEMIEETLEETRPCKVQLQNIWPQSMEEKWLFDKLLARVQTMELKFDEWVKLPRRTRRTWMTSVGCLISPALNLEGLSLIAPAIFSSSEVVRIIEKVQSKRFKSLTIDGLETCKAELKGILHPFEDSIKEITLASIIFTDMSFGRFVKYIQKHFSLDYICFNGIEEELFDCIIVDEVELYGEEIKKGLDNLVELYHNIDVGESLD